MAVTRRLCWAALALTAVALGFPPRADAAGKSFSLTALATDASISPDGSMEVSEQITYDFTGGPFNFGIRSFLAEDRDRITSFSVTDDTGTALETIPPATSESGEWEWRLGGVSDTIETYNIHYVVARAITLGPDVGELYWQFLGKDHPGIGRVDVNIHLQPQWFPVATDSTSPTDATVLRAWGHGPRQGTVVVRHDEVTLSVVDVPAKAFVEARLAIPASAFTGDATTGPRLPTIIREEGAFVDQTLAADRGRGSGGRSNEGIGNLLGPGAGIAGLAGLGAIWARFGREPRPDPMIGEYWHEPLEDPPAVVLANLKKGTAPLGPAIGATLIDLAQRGYLTIAEERHERLGPDDVIHRLRWQGKPMDGLAPFERELLEHVFLGRGEVTTDDVTAWAKANQSAARAFAKDFQVKVGQAYAAKGYKAKGRGGATAWLAGIAAVIAIAGFVSSRLGGHLALVAYITAGVVFAVGSVLIANRTQRGSDEAAKAESLKRFLKDFSNLEEAPAGHLILWERFLVYAVTLGVAKELLHGLETRLPSVLNDPNYGIWYVGTAGIGRRFDGLDQFPRTFGARTATAFAPPSKSGGGGGFSGGGGGGGGGGGFGAR